MANLLELLVTADCNNPLWTASIWDSHIGTNLMTYKGGGTAESKTLSFIGNDYIAAVEKTKPILHIWPLNSHQPVQGMRFILPGKASALSITRDGSYICAGIEEKIYLWQTASGNLLTIISRHYQKVVSLKFTPDGKYFISAAEDGMVMVWSLASVAAHPEIDLVTQSSAGQHDPVHIFSDHSLPVTDLFISKFGMHGRLCTVSSDRTCKIYDLSTGEMLLNLVFDVPLSAVTMDVLELNVFVGSNEGKIYQFSLAHPPRSRDLLINSENGSPVFTLHTKAITCLSVSLDGETLMSGSNDEHVILWHIPSRQPIRTIRHKGPITNGFFTVNLPAIFQSEFCPDLVLHSLERTLEKDSDEATEIEVLINKKISFWPEQNSYEIKEIIQQTETSFMGQEKKWKNEIESLKAVNAKLYAFSINKAIDAVPLVNESIIKKAKKKKNNKKNK